MWETALAFAIWGSYGSALTAAHIDPVADRDRAQRRPRHPPDDRQCRASRASRGPREITAAIPWRSGALWLSGSVLLVDEVLYSVSAVSGPVAIIGLAYGCVPIAGAAALAARRHRPRRHDAARDTGSAWRWPSPAT